MKKMFNKPDSPSAARNGTTGKSVGNGSAGTNLTGELDRFKRHAAPDTCNEPETSKRRKGDPRKPVTWLERASFREQLEEEDYPSPFGFRI
jgi:hypothetical protein